MRLRELRDRRGLKQSDLAEYLRVERSTYVKYEGGVSEPSLEKLLMLCDFYSVTLDYLIGRALPEGHLSIECSPDETELIMNYRNLSEDGKQYIKTQLSIASTIYKKSGSVPDVESGPQKDVARKEEA